MIHHNEEKLEHAPMAINSSEGQGYVLIDDGNTPIQVYGNCRHKTARRLTACWNALLELSTDDLEKYGLVGAFGSWYAIAKEKHEATKQQNSDLVEALKKVLPYMEAAEKAGLVGDEGCHWPVEEIRALLAKCGVKVNE